MNEKLRSARARAARTASAWTGELKTRKVNALPVLGSEQGLVGGERPPQWAHGRPEPGHAAAVQPGEELAGHRPRDQGLLGRVAGDRQGASTTSSPGTPALANARVEGHPPSTSPEAIARTSFDSASAAPSPYSVFSSTLSRPWETLPRFWTNAWAVVLAVGVGFRSECCRVRTTVSPPVLSDPWVVGAGGGHGQDHDGDDHAGRDPRAGAWEPPLGRDVAMVDVHDWTLGAARPATNRASQGRHVDNTAQAHV